MIINKITEFCIQYDEISSLMRVAWMADRNMERFQQAFTQLRVLVKRLCVKRIVLELNMMPDVPVYDQLWLSTKFMPALFTVPLEQVVIVLSAQRVYNQQVVEGVLMAVDAQLPFEAHFFTHPAPALAWLTDESPRLPGLWAEWVHYFGAFFSYSDEVAEPLAGYQPQ
ncbi:hypothetical protein [Hymenobacter sp. BRD67]|uniref:hypothetical protein n=1 Tax=Hymenobacter sp. BRD67 TaxID=2675877 RepID=UPI0015674363|nr:hypothetical protein [Hymenobacter sp. BRD67]QKG54203.1 hypothetical protein GKZ67_18375 [Hymenobacter sp. BRD67]